MQTKNQNLKKKHFLKIHHQKQQQEIEHAQIES